MPRTSPASSRMIVAASCSPAGIVGRFRPSPLPGKPRQLELDTTMRGYQFAAGMNGAILGRGADIILIDDPIKATDALSEADRRRRVNDAFDNTLRARLVPTRSTAPSSSSCSACIRTTSSGHVLDKDEWGWSRFRGRPRMKTFQLSDNPADLYYRRVGEVIHAAREPLDVFEGLPPRSGRLCLLEPVPAGAAAARGMWSSATGCAAMTRRRRRSSMCSRVGTLHRRCRRPRTGRNRNGVGRQGLDFYLLDRFRGRLEVPELRHEIGGAGRIRWNSSTRR